MKASDRKMRILKVIIDDFIDTAQPVGSRTIAKKYPLGVSSATIRNEMADLEDLGYLTQPHTSAGRIPSDMGYRIYVDSLLNSERDISKEKMKLIRGLLINRVIEVEDIIEEAVELLSKLTGATALITMPQFRK
ncbi:MAG: HrcA family transcriptional regulator, partial [Acidaminobacteraceae bacterium]